MTRRALSFSATRRSPADLEVLRSGFACSLTVERGCAHAGKPSAGRLGKFLVQAQFQGSVHSSALFLTAAAQNLLCMKLATELGVAIPNPWVTWFKGALVPAALGLLVTPLLMYKVRAPLAPASLAAAWGAEVRACSTSSGDQEGCYCVECAFFCSPPRPSLAPIDG